LVIKLSDFGHSKLVGDGFSVAFTRAGTPQYWAPEVSDPRLAGGKGYGQAVDLWSLGVILYVMLVGTYPFNQEQYPQFIEQPTQKLNFGNPETRPSESAQRLISSLIKVKPSERLSLCGCLCHDWVTNNDDIPRINAVASSTSYIAFQLPVNSANHPNSKERRNLMVQDVIAFQKKFQCFAQVRRGEIVVDLSQLSAEQVPIAKQDVVGIIRHWEGPDYTPPERRLNSLNENGAGYSRPLESVQERPKHAIRTITTYLNIGDDGAGIDLEPEAKGMRIKNICPNPGQPDLKAQDLIVDINGVSLEGIADPWAVEAIFGQNFHAGVSIVVKRT